MAIRQRRGQKKKKKIQNASTTTNGKSKNKKSLDVKTHYDLDTWNARNWKCQSTAVVVLVLLILILIAGYYDVMSPYRVENEEKIDVENEVENSQSKEEIIADNENEVNPKSARIKDTLLLGENSYRGNVISIILFWLFQRIRELCLQTDSPTDSPTFIIRSGGDSES